MSIQTRLKKQRYGEMNIKAPSKYDLDDYGLKTTRLRKPDPDTIDKIIYQMLNPPFRDRYYIHYIYTVKTYLKYLSFATKQSRWQSHSQILDIHATGKLIYMNDHPARFHGFQNFKYSWMYNILCAMRTYVLRQRYLRGEIQTSNSTEQWSAGFEPWPKPMTNRAMALLADNIYDLVQPRYELIKARSAA